MGNDKLVITFSLITHIRNAQAALKAGDTGSALAALEKVINGVENHATTLSQEKNAGLVAAAPELLEALEALMPLWEREDVADEWSEEFEAASAAIAKGKGATVAGKTEDGK